MRQIKRIQEAATGLDEALARAQGRVTAEYEAWMLAMRLIVAELEREADGLNERAEGGLHVSIRRYDEVTVDDYQALLRRDHTGSGWLAAVQGRMPGRSAPISFSLMGFRTPQMIRLGQCHRGAASILLKEGIRPETSPTCGLTAVVRGDERDHLRRRPVCSAIRIRRE